MTLKEFKSYFFKQLTNKYPTTEIDSFFNLLIENELNFKRIDIALNPNFILNEKTCSNFNLAIDKLKQQQPIQYILGKTEFYGLHFFVSKDTLIPRPETEELVNWIIESNNKNSELSILDIGTGTGCIAISLAKQLPKSNVFAIDISPKALEIAKKNAALNQVSVSFIEADILTTKSIAHLLTTHCLPTINFDIIVSNPPYVRELEKKEILDNVLKHEPHSALFVPNNNPLLFYKTIADLSLAHFNKNNNAQLYFEINQYLGQETKNMLKNKGFKTELKKDIFNNDRMTKSIIK